MAEPSKFDIELGKLIRLHRTTRYLTQEKLASRIDVLPSLIEDYETGAQGVPLKRFCTIMSALDQDPASALANLQQRLVLANIDPDPASTGQRFLASNRGRQIINALAMCDQPEALDALADLIMAMGMHACVRNGMTQNLPDERVETSNPS